jgi:FAD/FMN-containing dehydrogenase
MARPQKGVDDIWGYTPQGLDLAQAIKHRWDPDGRLNPGTFII